MTPEVRPTFMETGGSIRQEAIEIVGQDIIDGLENQYREIEEIETFKSAPNPFEPSRLPLEVDLSPLDQAESKILSEVATIGFTDSGRRRGSGLRTALKATKSDDSASRVLDHTIDNLNAITEELKDITGKVEALLSSNAEDIDEHRNEVAQTIELRKALSDLASSYPSTATVEVVRLAFKAGRAQLESMYLLGNSRAIRDSEARSKLTAKSQKEKIDEVNKDLETKAQFARAVFDETTDLLTYGQVHLGSSIADKVAKIKTQLFEEKGYLKPELKRKVLDCEDYLTNIVLETQQLLESIWPSITEQRMIANYFNKSQLNPVGREVSHDLNSGVNEARDILKGGQRLRKKQGDEIDKLATALHSEGRRNDWSSLSIEANGLIVAIVADKWRRFINTVSEVQTENPTDAARIIARQRPDVIDVIREFQLDETIDTLNSPNATKLLKASLTSEQYRKFDEAMRTLRGEDQVTEDEPMSAEEQIPHLYEDVMMKLDWAILPYGEKVLIEEAEKIVRAIQERSKSKPVDIDLERLLTLQRIKESWGEDRSYYAKGSLSGRNIIKVEGEEYPDEYIVLVLQQLDNEGNVVMEHAIAESPITQRNAMYAMRQDVSTLSWREVFAVSKSDARYFGARQLKHTKGDGTGLVNVMHNKGIHLLSCSPEEFFRIKFSGQRVLISQT